VEYKKETTSIEKRPVKERCRLSERHVYFQAPHIAVCNAMICNTKSNSKKGMSLNVSTSLCVCVCVREKDRESDAQRGRERRWGERERVRGEIERE